MLSGRGLCDELITRPEESYRLCCVVVCDLETSRIGAPYIYIYIYVTLVAYGLMDLASPAVSGTSVYANGLSTGQSARSLVSSNNRHLKYIECKFLLFRYPRSLPAVNMLLGNKLNVKHSMLFWKIFLYVTFMDNKSDNASEV